MKNLVRPLFLAGMLVLGGCAGIFRQTPSLGDPAEVVQQKMGKPTAVYPAENGQEWEYATGPMGQFTWMAKIGTDGRLAAYEQVLTSEKFALVKIDSWTKDEILRTFGRPAERGGVAMHNYEVWSYRYKEASVWNSMMHVHFDGGGVVRAMVNGPDPMYDPRDKFGR